MRRALYILLFLFFVVPAKAQSLGDSEIDSLSRLFYTYGENDTMRLNISISLAKEHYNSDSTILWSKRALDYALRYGDTYREAYSLYYIAWGLYYQDRYKEAMDYLYRSIYISEQNGYNHLSGEAYRALGDCNCYLSDLEMSDSCYHMALRIFYSEKDTTRIATTMYALALNYNDQLLYTEADSTFMEAARLCVLSGDSYTEAVCYQGLAELYLRRVQVNLSSPDYSYIEKSKQYITRADSIFGGEHDSFLTFKIMDCMSSVLFHQILCYKPKGRQRQEMVDSILMCYKRGMDVDAMQDLGSDSHVLSVIYARYNILKGNYDKARHVLDSVAKEYADSSEFILCSNYYLTYEYLCKCVSDYDGELFFRSKYYEDLLSKYTVNYALKATKYEYQERYNALKESDRLRQKHLTEILVMLGLVFVFTLLILLRHRKHNRVLNAKNEEISLKNRQITDSMNYASRIQKAVLPSDRRLQQMFSGYFVIYRPLHIVAGDFYWAVEISNYRILVCADCTGHGVPGAFLCMLGTSLLNEICPRVIDAGGSAADILDMLRRRLKFSLGQTMAHDNASASMDGIDMSLVLINSNDLTASYAGAYRPLWIFRDGKVVKYNPDKMPIGVYMGVEHPFTNNEIQLRSGDVLYMFSDGIPDQLGYIDDSMTEAERYCTGRLLKLVNEVGAMDLQSQRERIEHEIDTWRNGYKQLDDNLMIGVRI